VKQIAINMDFIARLKELWDKNNTLLCIGLDPDMDKLPDHLKQDSTALFSFNKAIIEATHELVCAYKPNSAFYESHGASGIEQLKQTCEYIKSTYPDIPVILDFKRGDIGNTNNHYAAFAFDYLKVDAITVNPYMGRDTLQAYLDHKDKGVIILCRTSNPGAAELQDLKVGDNKIYEVLADKVAKEWNSNGNCLLVVGATYPDELANIRRRVGNDLVFLVPGVGAQGADIKATIEAGRNKEGSGLIINSARGIIYASSNEDFAEAARDQATKLRDEINQYRRVA
jgi:orotidine-5'-phosphate decarboxylase